MPVVETAEAVQQIVDVFDELRARNAHPADAFFFFVGTGISAPQVPLAGAIEEECRRRVGDRPVADAPGAASTGMERYTYWLQKAYPQPVGRQQYFRSLIETKPISAANLRLAHLLLSDRAPRLVLTPNFDDFLARALDLFGKPHVSCDHPALAERIDPERTDDIQILHVHGSYWFYDLRNLRGELRERAQADRAYESIAWRVQNLMENRSPLVLGYSGWEDDVFMTALRRRLEAHPLRYNLYWFCYRREEAAALPAFLTERDDVTIVVPSEAQAGVSQSTSSQASAPKDRALEGAAAVFDALIRALELEVPPLTQNPLSFFAEQLRRSLIPVEEGGQSIEDVYGMNPLIQRIETLAGEWVAERAAGEEIEDPELVAVRNALRRSQYREAIGHAAAVELDRLSDAQLAELAEAAWLANGALLDVADDELRGYGVAVAAYDALTARGATHAIALRVQTARALLYRSFTLSRTGREQEAVEGYDELVRRFGEATEPEVQEQVAFAFFNKAVVLGNLGQAQEELSFYDEVVRRAGATDTPAMREQVATALNNKGYRLRVLGRGDEALPAFDEVEARFGDAAELELQRPVVMALVNKGAALRELERGEEALPVLDEVVRRFGEVDDVAVREQVAMALRGKGLALGDLDRGEEALEAFDELLARFGEATEPPVEVQVAAALVNKGYRLGMLGRSDEELAVSDEVVRRFGEAEVLSLREQVAWALNNKGYRLRSLGRGEEALPVFDEMVARFGEAEEMQLEQPVAMALVNKGATLNELGRPAEAVAVMDEVVRRFGEVDDASLREQVAMAFRGKALALAESGRGEEGLAVLDEVAARFGETAEPPVEAQVAAALVNKGILLRTLGREDDATAAFTEVISRWGDDPGPAMVEPVAEARAALDAPDAGGETD